MSHISSPTTTKGNKRETSTSDEDVRSLLLKVLKELKILNIHMESITGEEVLKEDIE